jgi:hypothetical protein
MGFKHVIHLPCLLIFLLAGCSASTPIVDEASEAPFTFTNQPLVDSINALSPDGKFITLANMTQIDLQTGQEIQPYREYSGLEMWMGSSVGPMGWSPDGQYLAVTAFYDDRRLGVNRSPTILFDTKLRTAEQKENISTFRSWSPFNTGRFMASAKDDGWNIFSVHDSSMSPVTDAIDFRQEKEMGGTGEFLWSKELDRPVAFLSWELVVRPDGVITGAMELVIDSFSDPMNYLHPAYRQSTGYQERAGTQAVNSIFSPDGNNILVSEWICNQTCHGSEGELLPENVKDTRLLLINWRTGEEKVLARLSEIDSTHLAASGDAAWSQDGKVILLGRVDAPALLLELK